jgi:SAM-dependent methyltransferase
MTNWKELYSQQISDKLRYPESFIQRMLLSSYPTKMVSTHPNASILDLSCGYGRNLQLLLDLALDVHATEISPEIIEVLRPYFPTVSMAVGTASSLPYSDNFFDIIMACNSCYYLDHKKGFKDNLQEIFRILQQDGCFAGSILGPKHSLINGLDRAADGSVTIPRSKLNFRNSSTVFEKGQRIQVIESPDQLLSLLSPFATDIKIGELLDSCQNTIRHLYYFSCTAKRAL